MKQSSIEAPNNIPDQTEDNTINIDIKTIFRSLWVNRKLILKIVVIFLVIGILVAIFSPTKYISSSVMVPQETESKSGGLTGLAAMAGISLTSSGDNIPMNLYPQILNNILFQKDLIYSSVKFEAYEEPVVLLDYYTSEEYNKSGFTDYLRKYTIGLPGLILTAIRGEKEEDTSNNNQDIPTLTEDEKRCIDVLLSKISIDVNNKDGFITVSATMHEPLATAQFAERVQILLQKYITDFKIAKVQSNMDFVQARYDEVKKEYEQIQKERAAFKDSNKNIYSARAMAESENWDNRYNLAFSIYSELAKQLEQSKIQVKETTPMLTVIDPVTVPLYKAAPRRGIICLMFLFSGLVVGIGLVLGLPFLADMLGIEKLRKIIKE